jgi:8-oxo-dGTP pyrophosphatase MutT (NUDIX family)
MTIKRAGVIVHNSANEVLMVKGKATRKWSFPKGKIEDGESVLNCAKREFFEETGRKLDGTETCVGIFTDMDCQYYVLHIKEKELEKSGTIDLSEVIMAQWQPEKTLNELNMNHNSRIYNNLHIIPKYRKRVLKKKIVDEEGWNTIV